MGAATVIYCVNFMFTISLELQNNPEEAEAQATISFSR
jgi:hypothetical protein